MGWEQLIAISKEAREERERERSEPPSACPNDGEPLEYDEKRGVLHCPFDGYTVAGRPRD
jgi:hypothetical protein